MELLRCSSIKFRRQEWNLKIWCKRHGHDMRCNKGSHITVPKRTQLLVYMGFIWFCILIESCILTTVLSNVDNSGTRAVVSGNSVYACCFQWFPCSFQINCFLSSICEWNLLIVPRPMALSKHQLLDCATQIILYKGTSLKHRGDVLVSWHCMFLLTLRSKDTHIQVLVVTGSSAEVL